MVALAQMAELVHHDVLEHRLGCQDQAPVEVDRALARAAAPEVLVLLDPDARSARGRGAARGARPSAARRRARRASASAAALPRPRLARVLRRARRQPDLEPGALAGRSARLCATARTLSSTHWPAQQDPAAGGEPRRPLMRLEGLPQRADLGGTQSRWRSTKAPISSVPARSGATTSTPSARTVMRRRRARPLRRRRQAIVHGPICSVGKAFLRLYRVAGAPRTLAERAAAG